MDQSSDPQAWMAYPWPDALVAASTGSAVGESQDAHRGRRG